MIERQRNKRDLLPFAGAAVCFSAAFLISLATPVHANTLGTLSIPSANLSEESQSDVSAAILGTSSAHASVVANRTVKLQRGDTLGRLLAREGISADQRDSALKALSDLYDVSKLKAGDEIEFSMRASLDGATPAQLVALHLRTAHDQLLTVVAGADGVFHRIGKRNNDTQSANVSVGVTTRRGSIKHDLMSDLVAANIPQGVAEDVVAAFTYDPEVPSKPSSGSRFTVVYETAKAMTGGATYTMRYAELSVFGQQHRVYRYETNDGTVAFMEEDGRGVAPFQLGAPVHDARMTSPWGWRVHPVLKVRKFHKGIDFAAPKGTPIYAAEDGVIQTIGWRGNYGRFIKIAHNERVATTYGHMSGFAKGLHQGSKVKKGQVIAYIGSSGLSTGNHLYYEVLVDNKQVDPSRPGIMLQVNLDGSSLVRFRTYVAQISQAMDQDQP